MLAYCPTCSNMLLGEQKGQSALHNHVMSTISTRLDGSLTLLLPLLPAPMLPLLLLPHTVELTDFTKELRYCCQTCPYVYKITKKVGLAADTGSRLLADSDTLQQTRCRWRCCCCCCLPQITKHAKLEHKAVDDVLGGAEAWKNVQKTDGAASLSSAGLQPACVPVPHSTR